MATNENLVIKYGDFTLDFNTLPEASLVAALRSGVAHKFGNECASKVTAYFDPDQDTPPESTPEARSAYKAEVQKEMFAKFLAGTVGVSTRGPAIDPIVVIERRLAKADVTLVLKDNGLAWPKKAEDKVKMADGKEFTGKELIDRRLANPKYTSDIKARAAKIMKDQAAALKAAQMKAKDSGLSDL